MTGYQRVALLALVCLVAVVHGNPDRTHRRFQRETELSVSGSGNCAVWNSLERSRDATEGQQLRERHHLVFSMCGGDEDDEDGNAGWDTCLRLRGLSQYTHHEKTGGTVERSQTQNWVKTGIRDVIEYTPSGDPGYQEGTDAVVNRWTMCGSWGAPTCRTNSTSDVDLHVCCIENAAVAPDVGALTLPAGAFQVCCGVSSNGNYELDTLSSTGGERTVTPAGAKCWWNIDNAGLGPGNELAVQHRQRSRSRTRVRSETPDEQDDVARNEEESLEGTDDDPHDRFVFSWETNYYHGSSGKAVKRTESAKVDAASDDEHVEEEMYFSFELSNAIVFDPTLAWTSDDPGFPIWGYLLIALAAVAFIAASVVYIRRRNIAEGGMAPAGAEPKLSL